MATEQTPASTFVLGATRLGDAATESIEGTILDSWLKVFDAKLAALDARQDAFARRLGIRVDSMSETPEPSSGSEFARMTETRR